MAFKKKINSIETPSGKKHLDENFPVGSWVLRKKLRKQILVFYNFARAADDISDNPILIGQEKIKRLNLFKSTLKNGKVKIEKAYKIKKICEAHNIKIDYALNLLKAFKQDARKKRYKSWAELINYCKYSAVPVGRFMIDLHKEKREAYKYSDPLCIALQILNHLQDCKEDYEKLDRVYLPMVFLKKYNVRLTQLKKNSTDNNLRQAFNKILKNTENLIYLSNKNKKKMKHKFLSIETSFILEIAKKLLKLLKNKDPLKEKIVLNKFDYICCFIKSLYC